MDDLDEYQEWLYLTWGYGSEATYLTRDTNQEVTRLVGYSLVGIPRG